MALTERHDVRRPWRVVDERHLAGHRAVALLAEHHPLAVLALVHDLEPAAGHDVEAVGRIALADDDVAGLGGAQPELVEEQRADGVGEGAEHRGFPQQGVDRVPIDDRIVAVARVTLARICCCGHDPPVCTHEPRAVLYGLRDGADGGAAAHERGGATMTTTTPHVTRTYRVLKGVAWIVISVFYRRIDVTGDRAWRAPGRPTIVVANHTNALADPVVILAKLPGHPRFLAAGSWWKFAPARWLFRLAGVVPVYRRGDGGGAGANTATFAACHEALAEGRHARGVPRG